MDWKLYGLDGNFLQEVNCHYDSLDLSVMLYNASRVEVDFDNKVAKILKVISRMTFDQLKNKIEHLKVWSARGRIAPHKPLLILYSLKKLLQEDERELSYPEAKDDLKQLLVKYGTSKRARLEHPFLHLTNDGIWNLNKKVDVNKYTSKQLNNLVGGFTDDVYEILNEKPDLIQELINIILNKFFPKKLHKEILRDLDKVS